MHSPPSPSKLHSVCFSVLQHLEGDYGLYTWPCAPILAYYVYTNKDWVKGKKVLEVYSEKEST